MVAANYVPQRGDLVWLDFSPQTGREQMGRRPALVLSSRRYNRTGFGFICPITSKVKGHALEVPVDSGKIKGAVLVAHAKSLDWKARKLDYIGKATPSTLENVRRLLISILLD